MKSSKAIYAGSFYPLHDGHINVICKAARIFDLTVLLCENPNKSYNISAEKRAEIIKEEFKLWEDITINVKVLPQNKLLAEYAKENGYDYLVRSFRNGSEADTELQMAWANESISGIQTVFIMPSTEYIHLSSSFMRDVVRCRG